MTIDDLKSLMDAFEPASLLPDAETVLGILVIAARIAVLAGPILLLVAGIMYMFLSPKEANYYFGYRCYFGMGSDEAWRYSQRMAGLIWTGLGLVLTIVMAIVSGGFGGKEANDALSAALTCILWEAGLVALSCIVINSLVMYHFTAKGDRRRKK